jgi:hypothetical protein
MKTDTPQVEDLVALEKQEPDLSSAIHLLDSEINDIQNEEQRNGWNQWVLLGAIGGLLWLLTGELEKANTDWTSVVKIVLAGLLLIDTTKWVAFLLYSDLNPGSEVRFRWSHHHFGTNRLLAILELLRAILIMLLAFSSSLFDWKFLIPISVSYITLSFLLIIVLIGSFAPLFAVTNRRNRWTYVFVATLLLPLVLAIPSLLPMIPPLNQNHVSEFRIGGLIAGISFLLPMMIRTTGTSLVVPLLKELRRKLIAGRISAPNAVYEAEVISGGMQVADALKDDFLNMLALLEQIDEQTHNAALAISSMKENFPRSDDDAQTVAEKLKTHVALKDNYKSFLDQRARLLKEHKHQVEHFYKKVRRVLTLPTARATIMNIESLLQNRALASDKLFDQLIEIEAEFDKTIGAK